MERHNAVGAVRGMPWAQRSYVEGFLMTSSMRSAATPRGACMTATIESMKNDHDICIV